MIKTIISTHDDADSAWEEAFRYADQLKAMGKLPEFAIQVRKRAGVYYVILVDRRKR